MDDVATTFQGTAVTMDVLNNDLNKDGATICNIQATTTNGGTAVISGNKIRLYAECGILWMRTNSLTRYVNWLQPISKLANRSGQCHMLSQANGR